MLFHCFKIGCHLIFFHSIVLNTEFQIIGLPQQFAKLSHPIKSLPNSVILAPVDFVRKLGAIFDYVLSLVSPNISLPFLNFVFITFDI